ADQRDADRRDRGARRRARAQGSCPMSGRRERLRARAVQAAPTFARAPRRGLPTRVAAFAAVAAFAVFGAMLIATKAGGQDFSAGSAVPVFDVVDVYVDSDRPLAAWQFEL